MTMAAAIDSRTAQAGRWSKASRIAAVDIVSDLGKAEAIWRELEIRHVTHTPYQRFDFLAAWQRQAGEREGASALIAIAYNAERRPLALLPLACFRKYGVNVASFMQPAMECRVLPSVPACMIPASTSLREGSK